MSDHICTASHELRIRQLRSFVALAEELNFTRAARRMNITQPPFSHQIAQLEESLGVKLFERSSRRVELTDAGRLFLRDIRDVLDRLDKAVGQVRLVEEGVSGYIEVGLAGAHFYGPMPRIIAHYNRCFPNIAILLNEMRPVEQIHALLEHKIDLSISRSPQDSSTLRSVFLWPDPVVVAMPQGHPLAQRDRLNPADMVSEPMIMLRRETSPIAQQWYEHCVLLNPDARFVQFVEDVPAQISLVATGLGIAIVPLSTTEVFDNIEVRPLDNSGISMDVYGVFRKDMNKPQLNVLLRECRKFTEDELSRE